MAQLSKARGGSLLELLRQVRPRALALLKALLYAILAANSVPILEWLLRGRGRRQLDSVSALQANLMERPYISGVVIFKQKTTCAAISQAMQDTFLGEGEKYKSFGRWKDYPVISNWFWPYWKKDDDFKASRHIFDMPERTDHASLEEWVGKSQVKALDPNHPLWNCHVFSNYVNDEGKEVSAVVLRLHHSYGDGFTLLRMILQGCDPKRPPSSLSASKEAPRVDSTGSVSSSREPVGRPESKKSPKPGPLEVAMSGLGAAGKLVAMTNDPVSPLKSSRLIPAEDTRYVAWQCLEHSVNDIKAIGRPQNQTVNDVLIAALSTTLAKLAARGKGPVPAQANMVMWCSLNPMSNLYKDLTELPLELNNRGLGAVYLQLPLASKMGPKETCAEVQKRIKKLTTSPEPFLANRIMAFFGNWPRCVGKPLWDALGNKVTLSASNMPGPQFALSWLGVPVDSWLFFVPPTGTVSTFITIFTFNGKVSFGLGVDGSLLDQASLREAVRTDMDAALRELKQAQA
jgi:hypothetical protein